MKIFMILFVGLFLVSCGGTYNSESTVSSTVGNYEIISISSSGLYPTLYIVKDKETGTKYGSTYSKHKSSDVGVTFIEDSEIEGYEANLERLEDSNLSIEDKYKEVLILEAKLMEVNSKIFELKREYQKQFLGESK